MRKLYPSQMQGVPQSLQNIFNEIFRASQEADVVDIGQSFTINGSFTETRTLNVSAPTTANIAAVLATLISDMQRGGAVKAN